MAKTNKKVALVTGASRGIGQAIVFELLRGGFHVIALARNTKALESLDDKAARIAADCLTLVPFDLAKLDEIPQIVTSIFDRFGRLDALVGNAGVLGTITPLSDIGPHEWHNMMTINLHANFHLLQSCDALLRMSPNGRVVFVSSGAVQKMLPFWGPYSASKAALNAFGITYAREVALTNIKVNLFNPGPVATDIRLDAFPGEDPAILPQPCDVAPAIAALCADNCAINGQIIDWQPSSKRANI